MSTSEGTYGVKVTQRLKLSRWVLAIAVAVAIGIAALIAVLSTQSSTTTRSERNSVNPVARFAPAPVNGPSVVRDPQTHALLQARSPIQPSANNSPATVRDPITHARLAR